MSNNEIEKTTRAIFHEIHKQQCEDPIYRRLVSLLSPAYLNVPDDYFQNKICLDAGCGSNANAAYSMLQHGASMVHAFDLDDGFFDTANSLLQEYQGRYTLSVGNVLDMQYESELFDFVHCSGVLHHTTDIRKGIEELARVTKRGGILYIMTYGKGGLVRDITSFLREKYQTKEEFREFIDQLTPRFFYELLRHISISMQKHGDEFGKHLSDDMIQLLFDKDLVLTIKDRISAPLYEEHSEEELRDMLRQVGFTEIERLTRYPQLTNLRRFLCPMYHDYDSEFAKFFYGDGSIQLKACKGD